MFPVTGATANPVLFVQYKQMPASLVFVELVPPIGQITWPNGSILKIDAPAHRLHFGQQIFSAWCVYVHPVEKQAGGRGGRRQERQFAGRT